MKVLSFALTLMFAMICICCTLVVLIQEDAAFKLRLQNYITQTFSKNFDCDFQAQLADINLFTGKITLKQCQAQAIENKSWHWDADRIDVRIAYLASYTNKKIIMRITIHSLAAESLLHEGQLALIPHLKKLITPAPQGLPIEVAKLYLKRASLLCAHAHIKSSVAFHGFAELRTTHNNAHYFCNILLDEGSVAYKDSSLLDSLSGKIEGIIVTRTNNPHEHQSSVNLHGACKLVQQEGNDAACKLYGKWSPEKSQFSFETLSQAIQGTISVNTKKNSGEIEATMPFPYLLACMQIPTKNIAGIVQFSATTALDQLVEKAHLTFSLVKCSYQNLELPSLSLNMHYADKALQGTLQSTLYNKEIAHGSCIYDIEKQVARCSLVNSSTITLPESWSLPAQKIELSCKIEPLGSGIELYAEYATTIINQLTNEQRSVKGIAHITDQHIIAQGSGDQCSYDFLLGRKPFIHLEYADFYLRNEPVIKLKSTSDSTFNGAIQYPLIRFITNAAGFNIPGQGTMQINGKIKNEKIDLSLAVEQGNIRLPYVYNLLQDLKGNVTIDIKKRRISLKDWIFTLHKGSVRSSYAYAQFTEHGKLQYLHVPLTIDNCFLGMRKDLFALFSGALTFEYRENSAAQLSGSIMIDRAHIRNNIFSEEFLKNIIGQKINSPLKSNTNINLDIKSMTAAPLRVKTSFLEATAHARISVEGSLDNPAVTGNIEIINGMFLFPYKPLLIKRGKIYFLPQQMDDPVIDILAENNIRKYSVRMTVDGTAKNSHINFDATPSLQEEQIIALLLGGSEDGSLFLAMPTSVMSSIEQLVFGPAESSSQFQRALKNLFAPLKNLRITPSFSDQTARGGLRGSLVIDVNDRLRALIEHNFSLPEDVVIQVEYDLSDDARIRAIKDERGDLGGELEARWKF